MAPRRSGRLKPISAACLASTPEVNDANKKRVSLDCLPDALLLQVLASIEPSQGAERRCRPTVCLTIRPVQSATFAATCREILPLVCKRWSLLLQAPSAVWEVRALSCLMLFLVYVPEISQSVRLCRAWCWTSATKMHRTKGYCEAQSKVGWKAGLVPSGT